MGVGTQTVAGAAPAQPDSVTPHVVRVSASAAEAAAIASAWSEARMASATPAPLPDLTRPAAGVPADEAGPPVVVGPRRGAVGVDEIGDAADTSARVHGKLFYALGDEDYVCSATVVSSKHLNLVVTAAHCLNDHKKWASEVIFVPGYEDGETPLGRWVAKDLAVTGGWANGEDLRYDVGFVRVRRGDEGFLEQVVGARGIGFNTSREYRYRIYGYPGIKPFDGEELYRCETEFGGLDMTLDAPRPMRAECPMTAGASGGGWVVRNRRVLSVISYSYGCSQPPSVDDDCDHPEAGNVFGPYFGDQALHLYEALGGPPPKGRINR